MKAVNEIVIPQEALKQSRYLLRQSKAFLQRAKYLMWWELGEKLKESDPRYIKISDIEGALRLLENHYTTLKKDYDWSDFDSSKQTVKDYEKI